MDSERYTVHHTPEGEIEVYDSTLGEGLNDKTKIFDTAFKKSEQLELINDK